MGSSRNRNNVNALLSPSSPLAHSYTFSLFFLGTVLSLLFLAKSILVILSWCYCIKIECQELYSLITWCDIAFNPKWNSCNKHYIKQNSTPIRNSSKHKITSLCVCLFFFFFSDLVIGFHFSFCALQFF